MKTPGLKWIRLLLAAMMIIFIAGFMYPREVQAADNPVTVSSCKLNSSGSKLTVKAKVKSKTKAMGKKLYLLGLDAYSSESGTKSAAPLASVKTKRGTITFKVKYKSTMLYQKFAVAYKTKGKYKIVSDAKYITNPEALATYTGSGPKAKSKKGLQVEELSDSLEIGTKHAVINWTLNSILNNGAINRMPYKYRGKTYYLDADQIQRNDELVRAYNAAGVRVTIILLLPKDAGSSGTASMQYGGYSYTQFSSIKTSTKTACRTFEAVMSFLAQHYGTKENLVSGWILGNEVNSACIWNYGGGKSLSSYINNYARSFRICYNAVKSVSKNAKVYISLDNNWNRDIDRTRNQYFSSKATLDKFYSKIKAQGKITFQIAYHAYPQGMADPVFWDDSMATHSTKAKIINFKNLSVLTNYVKKSFGKKYTIMLSEQSFNSNKGEAVQAAAYAYAYYISESNSMIEAFIYGREFDHETETKQGYRWGLCDNWHVKRLVWSVFQYIDTKDTFKFTDPLLKYTNLKKWSKISGFKKSKYSGMASIRTKAAITEIESASSSSVTLTWEKQNTGDGYEIYRNGKCVATISGNSNVSYTDKGLSAGTAYSYKVRMYKEAPKKGNANQRVKLYGSFSKTRSITVSAGQVVINKEKCSVSGNAITTAWKKMSDVSGYEISRSTDINGNYTVLGTVAATKTSYKDTATLSGTTYYYKVRAYVTVNGVNIYGKYSEPVSAQALIQLSVKIVSGKVVLNWTQWQNTIKYRVYCAAASESSYTRMKTLDGLTYSSTGYGNVTFRVGETYRFRVRADFGDGTYSKYSNVVEFTIGEAIDGTGILQEDETEIPDTETESTEVPDTETENAETETTETENTETPNTETESTDTENTESTETENTEVPDTETEATETESSETENTELPDRETETTETETTETESTETENTGSPAEETNSDTENSEILTSET